MTDVTDIIGAATSSLVITAETSILPPIVVYDGSKPDTGPSLTASMLGLLGISGGLVVRTASGNVLATVGQPAKFQPLRALLLALGIAGAVIVAVAFIRRTARNA